MSNGILDSDQSRALRELIEEHVVAKPVETEEQQSAEQQPITEQNTQTGTEKYVSTTRDHISKRNENRLHEKNDLLAGPESVTSAQLKQSNQELWNRVQTALSGLGGGGLGAADVLDLIRRNPSYDFYVDSDFDQIASRLDDKLVKRSGDSMYGTLHLNHYDSTNTTGNIPLLKLDPPPNDSAYIGVFTQNDGALSVSDPSILALRLHGYSSNQKFVIRTGTNGADSRGDVFEINCAGDMQIKSGYTTNYSQFQTKGRTVSVQDNGGAFVAKTGTNVITNAIRTWDSDFRLHRYDDDLKMQVGETNTQFWNEQVRVHGKLYVNDSGTFGNDLTVGGDISASDLTVGDINSSAIDCDSIDASNVDISGNLTASTAQFGQDVSIGEDVSIGGNLSVDSGLSADSVQSSRVNIDRATTVSDEPFFKFYEENGTHTLSVGWDLALTSNVEGDIDTMGLVTSENKILRLGFKNQNGIYEFPISVGTGDVTSDDLARQRSTRIRYLAEPAASYDAVPLGYLTNSYGSRLQPTQIGDSSQRGSLQTSFATPIDSTDSSGGEGTFFFNTAAQRLEVFKDNAWVSLRSKFDSGEVVGIVNSLRYTTADHDSDTLVQVDSAYVQSRVPTDQSLLSTDNVTFQHIHMTHASGALSFAAKNETGSTVAKGTAVFINGVSGDIPTIGLADADTANMPAYGLVEADANNNAETHVLTFGTISGIDTSAFAVGDTLYISTTAGELTNIPPAGKSAKIQNIGRVIRSHASAGSIKVGGAGRSNATPNLDAGEIFYGSDSNRSEATLLTSVVDSNYVQTRIDASQLDFSGVPTSDPSSAGLVWRDSDNGNVLKVSVG